MVSESYLYYGKYLLLLLMLPFFAFIEQDERNRYFPALVEYPESLPDKENLWVFILAGQSNMAGRGQVEPQDTLPDPRVLTINQRGEVIVAKSPLHFYEPSRSGLDLGHRFGNVMAEHLPDSVSVLLIPTAIGGSSISQWLGDEEFRGVMLKSNFRDRTALAGTVGTFKAVLWHQGESDSNENDIPYYRERLRNLLTQFREFTGDAHLPVILGELGLHDKNALNRARINEIIHEYAADDPRAAVVRTTDLSHIGDSTHFDAEALRAMGERYALAYLNKFHQPETANELKRGFWERLRSFFRFRKS
jgi:hypothetical protein